MIKKFLKFIFKTSILLVIILTLFLAGVYRGVFGHVFTEDELKNFKNETASVVVSDDGRWIGKFFAKNRTNVEYKEIPKHLINALVATEDTRYFEHEGIDSRSLLRVLIKTLIMGQKSAGGGSTITQQLAKNMYGRKNYGKLSMPINKFKEVILAHRLEKIYSKEDILTLYLNTVPFGENVLGIESAAKRFFNKDVKQLKIEESTILIGMLKANTYYNPRLYPDHAIKRRNVVLAQMEKYGYLSTVDTDSIQKLPLGLHYANLDSEGFASYFLIQVKKEARKILKSINEKYDRDYDVKKSGLIIETTLNYDLQQYALDAFQSHLSKMQKLLRKQYLNGASKVTLQKLTNKALKKAKLTKVASVKKKREVFTWDDAKAKSISIRDSIKQSLTLLQAGFLVVEPKTGAIKTWIGGIDYRSQPYDQIFAQRQMASSFKPILYVTALENGMMPCQYLENDEIVLSDYSNWSPKNYNHTVGGAYSFSAALAKSMNIPTVNLFLETPFSNLENVWTKLGYSQRLAQEPSTALGTTTASLYEMAFAYAAFANGGYRVEPQIITSIKTASGKVIYQNKKIKLSHRVLKKQSTVLLNEILQKAIKEGTGRSMKSIYGVDLPLAGKTGTSQNYADAWFAAYSPNLVLVTRVGATSPLIHFNNGRNGSGGSLALPLVAKTLRRIQVSSRLTKRYFPPFKPLPPYMADALNCEDYMESFGTENLFESVFKKKSKKSSQKKKKKKSFFKRLFGK